MKAVQNQIMFHKNLKHMSAQFQPNIAADLFRIHTIITRGIGVSIRCCRIISENELRTFDGFLNYVLTLSTVIDSYHLEGSMGFDETIPAGVKSITPIPFPVIPGHCYIVEL
jgi:hypothetical protein